VIRSVVSPYNSLSNPLSQFITPLFLPRAAFCSVSAGLLCFECFFTKISFHMLKSMFYLNFYWDSPFMDCGKFDYINLETIRSIPIYSFKSNSFMPCCYSSSNNPDESKSSSIEGPVAGRI